MKNILENNLSIKDIDYILMTYEYNFLFKISDNILLLLCYDLNKDKIKEKLINDLIFISKLRKKNNHMPTSKFFYRRLFDDQYGQTDLRVMNKRMEYLSYVNKMEPKENLDRKKVIRIMKRFFKIYSRKIAYGCPSSIINDLVNSCPFHK